MEESKFEDEFKSQSLNLSYNKNNLRDVQNINTLLKNQSNSKKFTWEKEGEKVIKIF